MPFVCFADGRSSSLAASHGLMAMLLILIINVPSQAVPVSQRLHDVSSVDPFPRVARSASSSAESQPSSGSSSSSYFKRSSNDLELENSVNPNPLTTSDVINVSSQPPVFRHPHRSKRQALIPFPRTGKRSAPWSNNPWGTDVGKRGSMSALIPFPRTGKRSSPPLQVQDDSSSINKEVDKRSSHKRRSVNAGAAAYLYAPTADWSNNPWRRRSQSGATFVSDKRGSMSALIPFPRTGKRSGPASASNRSSVNFSHSDTPPFVEAFSGDHDFGRAVRPGLSYVDSVPRKSYYEMLQAYMKHLEPTDSGESESQEELVY